LGWPFGPPLAPYGDPAPGTAVADRPAVLDQWVAVVSNLVRPSGSGTREFCVRTLRCCLHQRTQRRGSQQRGPRIAVCRCHSDKNFNLSIDEASYQSIPGHPRWGLAPIEMAWEGKTPGEICRQIKDPSRNGGRDLALLHEHVARDNLVGWAWHPGAGRGPAPGSQEQFSTIIQAWIDAGAECP
jgi:hypothetical protein